MRQPVDGHDRLVQAVVVRLLHYGNAEAVVFKALRYSRAHVSRPVVLNECAVRGTLPRCVGAVGYVQHHDEILY